MKRAEIRVRECLFSIGGAKPRHISDFFRHFDWDKIGTHYRLKANNIWRLSCDFMYISHSPPAAHRMVPVTPLDEPKTVS